MKKHVEAGDILKTHPIPGFWVASVVLATQPQTEDFKAMCLVGSTLCVFQHDFTFTELDHSALKVTRGISGFDADRPILYVYASRLKSGVEVIGSVDLAHITPQKFTLSFSRQDMPEWPMAGSLSCSIGSGAVHAWRSVHDHERWIADLVEARRSHEAMISRLKEESKVKRQTKKKTPNQAPQTTICTVTECAPSRTFRASADRV